MNVSHPNITTQSSGLIERRPARKHRKPRSRKPGNKARKCKPAARFRGTAAVRRSRLYGLFRAASANLKHSSKQKIAAAHANAGHAKVCSMRLKHFFPGLTVIAAYAHQRNNLLHLQNAE